MMKMTVAFHNFAKAPTNVFFAITLFNFKPICKKFKLKAKLDSLAYNTADLLIVKGKKAKLPRA